MGKSNNHIVLQGKFAFVVEQRNVKLNGKPTDVLEGMVDTDTLGLGGRHRCVFSGKQAAKVVAFLRAAQDLAATDEPLDVQVDGWLWSDIEHSAVVADNVTFYCSSALREKAMEYLNTWASRYPRAVEKE